MISITIQQLINCTDIIQKLLNMPFTFQTSYKIMRLAREVEKEYNFFIKNRNILLDKYGVKDSDGKFVLDHQGNYHIQQEKIDDFTKEYEEILNNTIELVVEQISINELKNISLTPNEVIKLEPFIK